MIDRAKIKDLIYRSQAFGLNILEKIFLVMGLKISSHVVGLLFAIFGVFTPPSFLAMRNIKKAMPEFGFFKRLRITLAMWNNLGQNLAEFVGFNTIKFKNLSNFINVDSKSAENLKKLKENKEGEVLFAAHFGNWEIFPQFFASYEIPISVVYREMNNKYADEIVLKYRQKRGIGLIPKGLKGTIQLARSLAAGRKIAILVDQRFNGGIEVPFFNIPSKTTDSVATLALKHHYKLYSIVAFRRSFSCFFDVKVEEFEPINTGNLPDDIRQTTIKINNKIESWIRSKPEQWFWVHDRWKEM